MDILLLIVGLGLILAGANFLTDGSAAVAQRFRVPEFIIGLTIVAVGTSTPELVVSVLSAIAGKSDVAIGNVVGSNIFNVFVILGVCALIRPLPLTRQNIRRDLPVGVAASLVLCAMLVIALAVQVLPAFIAKQQLDTFATELVREAEIAGRIGPETDRREQALREQTGLDPGIEWSDTGRIQLNEEVAVTLTHEIDLGLFAGFGSFPITLRADATGKSEVYWK